jgi:DNA-binding transcriptional ArsR family regulator
LVNYNDQSLDAVFFALSDPTRRDMLSRVAKGPVSVTGLAGSYRMSLPAVLKHVSVLEASGLVETDKIGRVRTCEFRPHALRAASDWIKDYQHFWEGQLDRLGQYLDEISKEERG